MKRLRGSAAARLASAIDAAADFVTGAAGGAVIAAASFAALTAARARYTVARRAVAMGALTRAIAA
jgi:hypothetical protein